MNNCRVLRTVLSKNNNNNDKFSKAKIGIKIQTLKLTNFSTKYNKYISQIFPAKPPGLHSLQSRMFFKTVVDCYFQLNLI